MRKIKDLDENFVVAHFIKGELDSENEGVKLRDAILKGKIPLSIVENPDTLNEEENYLRKYILNHYRGYPNSLLFNGFPTDMNWALYELDNNDLDSIMFINNDLFWKEITNNTRLIKDTKANNPHDPRQKKIVEISESLDKGAELPEMIIVTDDASSIILEGHHRGAAYALVSKKKDIKIQTIVGKSTNLKGWYYY